MGKDSFIIYKSFFKPISKLSDKQLGRLFRAIFEYNISGVVSVEEDIEMAFEFFKNQFDIDESKYQGKVERNRENGRRGGNQRAENNRIREVNNDASECKRMQANGSECKRNLANQAYNDNENDNEKDIKKENNSNELFEKENDSFLFPVTQQAPKKTAAKKFVKPTVQEVQAYCKERNNGINAEQFIDHYESKGWVVGKSPMKDWKAAVRTWERSRSTTSASEQSGANVPTGVILGTGEYIDKTGKRTYGPGKANIPMSAPPRPSGQYTWSIETQKWVIL